MNAPTSAARPSSLDRGPVVHSPAVPTVPPSDIDEHWLIPLPRRRPRSLFYRSLAEALRSNAALHAANPMPA